MLCSISCWIGLLLLNLINYFCFWLLAFVCWLFCFLEWKRFILFVYWWCLCCLLFVMCCLFMCGRSLMYFVYVFIEISSTKSIIHGVCLPFLIYRKHIYFSILINPIVFFSILSWEYIRTCVYIHPCVYIYCQLLDCEYTKYISDRPHINKQHITNNKQHKHHQ